MPYLELFLEFFKIGLFTFGGGYAMIPLVRELVLEQGWLTESQFLDFIGVCESTPGPIAINMATYIGSTQGGFFGSVCATLGVVLPSFIIIVLVATLLKKLIKNKYFQNALKGIKPIILALILSTGIILVAKVLGYIPKGETSNIQFDFDWKSTVIIVLLAGLFYGYKYIFKKKMPSILLIVIAAALGIIFCII